jgi:hypothetical protein
MAVGFAATIKPYFSACYRQHMLNFCDLWSASDVQVNWQDINDYVANGSMPKAGCPEGIWNQTQRDNFLRDFTTWKADGFQP